MHDIQLLRDKLAEYGELPGCFTDDADAVLESVQIATALLDGACVRYCTWFDTGHPPMDGGAMAYELVSSIRVALAQLKGESTGA